MVGDFPETLHQTGDNTDFSRPLRQSERGCASRVRASPRAVARRTREVLVEGAPPGAAGNAGYPPLSSVSIEAQFQEGVPVTDSEPCIGTPESGKFPAIS